MISLVACQGDYYSILGEVKEPGYKRIEGNPTVLSALCEAKGFTTRLYRDQTLINPTCQDPSCARGAICPYRFCQACRRGDISRILL